LVSARLRAWLIILAAALVCAGAILLVSTYRSRSIESSNLLARLPTNNSVVLWMDFRALRHAGILRLLSEAGAPEEPEYQQFVAATDFDYKQDLDHVMASFGPAGNYFLVRGRFDWGKLRSYATGHGGSCNVAVCTVAGSKPERQISFYPLRSTLMGLAVSQDPQAAKVLMEPRQGHRAVSAPADPLWISLPGAALGSGERLPEGTRMFAQSMQNAEEITLSAGPQGQAYEVRLNVRCRSGQDAARLSEQLERTTALLRQMIQKEKGKPNPRDMSGVLTAGTFSYKESRVFGRWPLPQEFLRNGTP
jgi:hypothetical protein